MWTEVASIGRKTSALEPNRWSVNANSAAFLTEQFPSVPLVDSMSINGKYKCVLQKAFVPHSKNKYRTVGSLLPLSSIAFSTVLLPFHQFGDAS